MRVDHASGKTDCLALLALRAGGETDRLDGDLIGHGRSVTGLLVHQFEASFDTFHTVTQSVEAMAIVHLFRIHARHFATDTRDPLFETGLPTNKLIANIAHVRNISTQRSEMLE